jgi:NitT/TauT family transport system substrate-binding protein
MRATTAPANQGRVRRALIAAGMAGITALGAGCSVAGTESGKPLGPGSPVVLRLGLLANITHAPALVGVAKGLFTKELGTGVTLKVIAFSAGTEEATALLAGNLDAAYVGPNPAIPAWPAAQGSIIRVISGAASGGAALVVKPGIVSPAQLKGRKLATPALGGTQDVALRYWLGQHHLTTTVTGGGDVPVTPVKPNSAAVLLFKSGQIAGGWEPAPYDIEMVQAGGHVLVDEASLWPRRQFVTTNLVVTQRFLTAHPSAVNGLLKGQIQANDYIHSHVRGAEAAANADLTKLLGKGLSQSVLSASFKEINFTDDPVAATLAADARHAASLGLLDPVKDISALYDLGPLNTLLKAAGEPQVRS